MYLRGSSVGADMPYLWREWVGRIVVDLSVQIPCLFNFKQIQSLYNRYTYTVLKILSVNRLVRQICVIKLFFNSSYDSIAC